MSFLLGVQWHAELLIERPGGGALFRSFVEAASRIRRAARRGSGRVNEAGVRA